MTRIRQGTHGLKWQNTLLGLLRRLQFVYFGRCIFSHPIKRPTNYSHSFVSFLIHTLHWYIIFTGFWPTQFLCHFSKRLLNSKKIVITISLRQGNCKLCFMMACWPVSVFCVKTKHASILRCINRALVLRALEDPCALNCQSHLGTQNHDHLSMGPAQLQGSSPCWGHVLCAAPPKVPKKPQACAAGKAISAAVHWILLPTLQVAPSPVRSLAIHSRTPPRPGPPFYLI